MRIQTIADFIARWSLILFAGLIPLFIIPAPWASVGQAKVLLATLLITVALLSWLSARFMEGAISLPRNLLFFTAVLLPLAYFISALASKAPAESYASGAGSQDTVAALALLVAVLGLYACVFRAAVREVAGPLWAFLIAGAAVLLFQMFRLVIPSWLSLGGALAGSASSVFGSWHDLALLCALLVFFASVLWSSPAVVRGRYRALIVGAIVAFGLVGFFQQMRSEHDGNALLFAKLAQVVPQIAPGRRI